MKRPLEVQDINVGNIPVLLWIIVVISFLSMIWQPWLEEVERAQNYRNSLPGVAEYIDARQHEFHYMRRLGRAINPWGLAPVTFTLSLGFLALLRGQRVSTAIMVAAAHPAPQQKPAPPPVPKPPPAPLVRPIGRAVVTGTGISMADDDLPTTLRPKR